MTTHRRSTSRSAVGAALLALLAAGCGGGADSNGSDSGGSEGSGEDFADQSAAAISKASAEDMKALTSVRIAGALTNEGQQTSVDMAVSAAGDCEGTIGVSGGTAEIISTSGSTWFKPDRAFWRATAGAQADQIMGVVGDKWVLMPPEQSDLASLCDLDELLDELDSEGDEHGTTEGQTEQVDGRDAVIVQSKTDEGDPLKVWVATEDEHYLLKMEVSAGEEPGTITFSDFDEELDVQAPAKNEVVDFSQMG